MRPEQIPYGVKDFKRIRLENRYYVDKTAYLRELEKRADFVFFVRPRRFGKTLLCETMEGVLPLTEELADHDEVTFDLVDSFPIEKVLDAKNFKSLYYYYGIVTMGRICRGDLMFRVPNECVRRQVFDYMRSAK